MSFYGSDEFNYNHSGYSNNPHVKNRSRIISTIALCLVSALVGGLVSIGVAPSLYANRIPSKPNSPAALGQPSTKPVNVGYNQSSFPVVNIAKSVGPAVVYIANFQASRGGNFPLDGGFGFFGGFGGNNGPFNRGNSSNNKNNIVETDSGSGFIIDSAKGYIVTNNHVVAGAQKLVVSLSDGRNIDAKLIGADPRTDLAVLQISDMKNLISDSNNLTAAQLGDSTKLQVGEPVVAIGNPGGEQFAGSVTAGVVSATNRILDLQGESSFDLIQTDATINPGNSGGPLVNYLGQVIGINSAKYSQPGFEGMGFAIPISEALPTIQQLIQKGYASHAGLNIQVANQYNPEYAVQQGWPKGTYIAQVIAGGSAAQAGLLQGDIITKVNELVISDSSDLTHELFKYQPGDKIKITYFRNGVTKVVSVTLTEIKD